MTQDSSISADRQELTLLHVSPHVRMCSCDGVVVLLDLRQGRYLSVGQSAAQSLIGRVRGWCTANNEQGALSPLTTDTQRLIQRLLALGVLCRDAAPRAQPPAIDEAKQSFDADASLMSGQVSDRCGQDFARRVSLIARFVWHTAASACWLRYFSLQTIVQRVTERQGRLRSAQSGVRRSLESDEHATSGAKSEAVSKTRPEPMSELSEEMRSAVVAFDRLRPLAFTARDRCLHDSLALTNFLASEGLCARWVIGVKLSPFGAHSWVQYGTTVLNDQHDYVRAFRPILVV